MRLEKSNNDLNLYLALENTNRIDRYIPGRSVRRCFLSMAGVQSRYYPADIWMVVRLAST